LDNGKISYINNNNFGRGLLGGGVNAFDDNVLYYDLFDNQYENNNLIVAGSEKYNFLKNSLKTHKNIYAGDFKAILFNTRGNNTFLPLDDESENNAEIIDIDIFSPIYLNPFSLLTDYDLFNYNTSFLFYMLIDFLYIFVPDRDKITTVMEKVVKRTISIALRQCYVSYGKDLSVEHIAVYLSHHSSDEITGMVENISLFVSKLGNFLLGRPDVRLKFDKQFTDIRFRHDIFDDYKHKVYLYKTSVSCILISAMFIHACNYVYKDKNKNSKTLLCVDSSRKVIDVCADVNQFIETASRNFKSYGAGLLLLQ
jgi:hypothetical protein